MRPPDDLLGERSSGRGARNQPFNPVSAMAPAHAAMRHCHINFGQMA